MQNLQSLLGIAALIGFAFLISENRRRVRWTQAGIALIATIPSPL